MKFALKNVAKNNIRLGTVCGIARLPEMLLDTPLLLLCTKGGSLPHITYEVLQMLTTQQQAVQISLPSSIHFHESLKGYKGGVSQFVGLKEYLTFCSVQDPAKATPQGYNSKSLISVWSHSGRVPLDPHKFMDLMEVFQPDMYQVLCDSDTNSETTKKRCFKAVDNSLTLFNKCFEKHVNSQVLKDKGIFAVIEGGYCPEARKKCSLYVANKPVQGFVIEGFHNNGGDVEYIDFKAVEPILEETLSYLPVDKLRVLPGSWRPEIVLKLVKMGIDIFDSSLAYVVTERFSSMVFSYKAVSCDTIVENEKSCEGKEYSFEISLEDSKYADDFGPLVEGCSCLTCRKHSRGYIYHLIKAKELLASTLLMLHNLHHYMEFFKAIRRAGEEGKTIILI